MRYRAWFVAVLVGPFAFGSSVGTTEAEGTLLDSLANSAGVGWLYDCLTKLWAVQAKWAFRFWELCVNQLAAVVAQFGFEPQLFRSELLEYVGLLNAWLPLEFVWLAIVSWFAITGIWLTVKMLLKIAPFIG